MKIPPPVYAVTAAALMWALDRFYPILETQHNWPLVVGAMLIPIGILVDVLAVVQFRTAKTTVNPMHPEATSSLVTNGLYAYSRNPMYIGLLLCLVGVALLLRSLTPLAILPLFVMIVTLLQIMPEERALQKNFGDEFSYYKQKVPRWLW